MALLPVQSMNVFSVSTGVKEFDLILSHHLLHLELHLESDSFVMSGIPHYIGRTLYEHMSGKRYTHRYLAMLNPERIPGSVYDRVNAVNISFQSDSSSCHRSSFPVSWCFCEGFSGIDGTTYTHTQGTTHEADLFSGLLLGAMYNAPITVNGQKINDVSVVSIQNEIALRINDMLFFQPPEACISFFSQYNYDGQILNKSPHNANRHSIEYVVKKFHRLNPLLKEVIITTGDNHMYSSEVLFNEGNKEHRICMIPSHAVLLSTLLGQGQISVEANLLK